MKRAPAMYGLEVSGETPSDIFSKADGLEAVESGEYVYNLCKRFIDEFIKEK